MVGVFSLFGSLSSLDVKQAGVGLGVAVLNVLSREEAAGAGRSHELIGHARQDHARFEEQQPLQVQRALVVQ